MKGMFVNEDGGIRYAAAIAEGYKPVETRSRNVLSALVGERVAIIRTRRGKAPMVIGYVWITDAMLMSGAWLSAHRDLTLIPEGSRYDCGGRAKWCYFLHDPETCKPYPLPADTVRHGRSWCEFQAPAPTPDAAETESMARLIAGELDRLAYLVDPAEYNANVSDISASVDYITVDLIRGRSAAYVDWIRGVIDGDPDGKDAERAAAILRHIDALEKRISANFAKTY